MSDLDDIVAAAGIVIVDTPQVGDGGDAENKDTANSCVNSGRQELAGGISGGSGDIAKILPAVAALEAMFGHRYTMEDPEYAQTVNEAEVNMQPPCVPDYRERRQRDNYNRGGRGGGYGRGGRGRGGGGYRHDNYNYNRQSYGYRGDHDNRNRHDRDGGDGSGGYHQHHQDRDRNRERYY